MKKYYEPEEVTVIDINGILIGPNGVKYKINKFALDNLDANTLPIDNEDPIYVVLEMVDKVEGGPDAIRIKIEDLHNYTVEK